MRILGHISIFLLLIMTILLFSTGCAPDPRKAANAYATRAEADRQSAAADVARQHLEELNDLETQAKQIDLETKQATVAELRQGLNTLIKVSSFFLTAAACFAIFMGARTFNTTLQGVGDAIIIRAQLNANLIPLDYKTRQYPLLRHIHGTTYLLSNPNDNSVTRLDAAKPADRQKIAAMGAVQLAGAIAFEARQSSDPAGISVIQPTVIDAQDEQVVTGAHLASEMASILRAGRGAQGARND